MTTSKPVPLVAGNWKMNGLYADLDQIKDLVARVDRARPSCELLICPPFTLITPMAEELGDCEIALGAQDCHFKIAGAHTGDVSAEMLADAGCRFVIVGHSERRADHNESSRLVRAKAEAAHRAGLVAIICVGEIEAERDAGEAWEVVDHQLTDSLPDTAGAGNTVIAYEPVWAIGTGRTPTPDDIQEMHGHIRQRLADARFRILYGGSVKATNAADLMAVDNVDGALVGGASLKAIDFDGILDAYR